MKNVGVPVTPLRSAESTYSVQAEALAPLVDFPLMTGHYRLGFLSRPPTVPRLVDRQCPPFGHKNMAVWGTDRACQVTYCR